jgi:hypothetical protein
MRQHPSLGGTLSGVPGRRVEGQGMADLDKPSFAIDRTLEKLKATMTAHR